MEFVPFLFFLFWSLISIVFSAAGTYALHRADIPVSDKVRLLIDYLIALAMHCSLVYAFVSGFVFPIDKQFDGHNSKVSLELFARSCESLVSPILGSSVLIYLKPLEEWNSRDVARVILLYVVLLSLRSDFELEALIFSMKAAGNIPIISFWEMFHGRLCLIPLQFLLIRFFHESLIFKYLCVNSILAWFYFRYAPSVKRFLAPYLKKLIETSSVAAYVYEHKRIIEIACGMLATTVAQYYFRVQSVALMLAFLSLAVAWLATLAIVQPSTDAGIFEFFVTSSMQSAGSLFGLHFYTFLVVFVGILLWFLRLKMESIRKRGHFVTPESWEEMVANEIGCRIILVASRKGMELGLGFCFGLPSSCIHVDYLECTGDRYRLTVLPRMYCGEMYIFGLRVLGVGAVLVSMWITIKN